MKNKRTSNTRGSKASRIDRTDWKRVDAMRDKDIDLSDIPEVTPEQFAKAVVRIGFKPIPAKLQITLRIDEDILDWFKRSGPGYQTRINNLLRAYVDAHGAVK